MGVYVYILLAYKYIMYVYRYLKYVYRCILYVYGHIMYVYSIILLVLPPFSAVYTFHATQQVCWSYKKRKKVDKSHIYTYI